MLHGVPRYPISTSAKCCCVVIILISRFSKESAAMRFLLQAKLILPKVPVSSLLLRNRIFNVYRLPRGSIVNAFQFSFDYRRLVKNYQPKKKEEEDYQ